MVWKTFHAQTNPACLSAVPHYIMCESGLYLYAISQGGEPTSWSLMFQKKITSDQVIK